MTAKPNRNAYLFGQTVHEAGWAAGKGLMKQQDVVGIEIEMEGVNPNAPPEWPAIANWRYDADGSLRNGIELVSARPRPWKAVEGDVEALAEAFTKLKFTPVFSFRTSLHVHVNVQSLTHIQLLNFFALYVIFEDMLFAMGGDERRGNVHCLGVNMAKNVIAQLREGIKCDRNTLVHVLQRLTRNDNRYGSFNWAAMAKFGSIEFRSHRGTMDPKAIQLWVNTLMALKFAAVDSFKNPLDVVQAFSTMGIDTFTDLVFKDLPEVANLARGYEQGMWAGMRDVQFFAFADRNWLAQDKAETPTLKKYVDPEAIFDVQPNEAPVAGNLEWVHNFVNPLAAHNGEQVRMQLPPGWGRNEGPVEAPPLMNAGARRAAQRAQQRAEERAAEEQRVREFLAARRQQRGEPN